MLPLPTAVPRAQAPRPYSCGDAHEVSPLPPAFTLFATWFPRLGNFRNEDFRAKHQRIFLMDT